MNPWVILVSIAIISAAVVLIVGAAGFLHFRHPWRARCPRDGVESQVQVDALEAARAEVTGRGRPSVDRCSHRWQVASCDEACLQLTAVERRPVRAGDAPLPVVGRPTVLVPLDGTPGSEAVLPTARAVARARAARLRLLRVMPITGTVRDLEERVVAYSDQESARDEHAARWYLRGLRGALADFDVEEVVRFGDPTAEILREAAQPDVAVIAMAAHRASGLRGRFRRSITRRVERAAWVRVMRAPYGATT